MLPPPPSGIGLEVQSASTLYFTVARSINDNLEVEFAAGYPHPRFDRQALACTASACAGVPGQVLARFGRLRPLCS
jgi:outer membrane protein